MTFIFNGFGTRLCGSRALKDEEIRAWINYLPYYPNEVEYEIATESIVICFLPIIPLKTFVYFHVGGFLSDRYQICFYPRRGRIFKIYWPHIKRSLSFYVWPILILLYIFLGIL